MADDTELPRALYSTTEVGEMCGVSPQAIRRWIQNDQIHALRINGAYRIPAAEVDRLRSGTWTEDP